MKFCTVAPRFDFAVFFILLTLIAGCTQSSPPSEELLKPGQAPFQFEVKKTQSLEIVKTDPKTGQSWNARFHRNPDTTWEIDSAPGGINPLDRKAHTTLIDHLLDSLRSLRVTALAPKGPLESFDLAPPHLALRWDGSEFSLGSGKYAAIKGTAYEMEGAAIKILDYVENFQSLRQATWLFPITSDDVDEIEIFRSLKPGAPSKTFYAQREGAAWTDRKHKPVKKDLSSFLDQLTHLRILEFIDDPETSSRLVKELQQKASTRAILKDRQGNATEIRLGGQKELYGISTHRPGVAFKLYPEAIRFFEVF